MKGKFLAAGAVLALGVAGFAMLWERGETPEIPPDSREATTTKPALSQQQPRISTPQGSAQRQLAAKAPVAQPTPGPVDREKLQFIMTLMSAPDITRVPSQEAVARFEALGFSFDKNSNSNPHTGTRTQFKSRSPVGGFAQLQLDYTADANGEYFEGIRSSFSDADGAFDRAVEDYEARLGAEWKRTPRQKLHAQWIGPEGKTLWLHRNVDGDPPSNTVSMALEFAVE